MSDTLKTAISGYSYLVVDDEEFIRTLVERILKSLGAENIRTAEGGKAALQTIDADGAPDIVLCDLNMPEMDGIEFLRHLVEREFKGGIAMISGEDKRILETAQELGKAQNLNILGALSKPITPPELTKLLDQFSHEAKTHGPRPGITVLPEELKAALDGGKITAHFQPKVSVQTKELIGVETLVRWIDPDKGFIPPDAFISVAEENGLIDQLTNTVLNVAMDQGAAWLASGLDIKIAVNLSVDNLNRLDLPEFIIETAQHAGMNPSHVVLEVTESRLMQDIVKPLEILTRLRLKGLALSIDDFGTGHSSMEQLKRIPFTELKIDRAFVNGAHNDDTARSILESSVTLAKKLGMTIVAEGVEDQEDWDLVESLGIDLIQGYFVCRPLPGPDLQDWLKEWG
ncbi:EAL domain-containing response regulator [Magnetovibrio sp. PR-2]|uniref:EAL domain-containing response regulator n=1 Tax=Magnetovibrio sp. PR-2 TaxID=3120356 RepID=UPI002FCDFA52